MELIRNKFKSFHLYFFGDLNCRIGTPVHRSIKYVDNIDKTINTNWVRLLDYIKEKRDLIIINGFIIEDKIFASKFTFYTCSQNDLMLTNALHTIDSFAIMENIHLL